MIHTLLNLTRPLFILDTETTGLNKDKARIIELGFQQWGPEGLVKEWRSYVDPGTPISKASSAIHGITDEMIQTLCRRCTMPIVNHPTAECPTGLPIMKFLHYARLLVTGFSNCDFAGKNVRFDLRILDVEMARAGVPWSYVGARILDADRLESLTNPRDLATMYKKYTGKELEGAHGALSDVQGTAEVLTEQLKVHDLPPDLDALHELSWPGWIVADGSFRFVDGEATIMFGKHRDTPMREVEPSYWDWMIQPKQKFPSDVLALAREAKMGKFPEPQCPDCGGALGGSFPKCASCQLVDAMKAGM